VLHVPEASLDSRGGKDIKRSLILTMPGSEDTQRTAPVAVVIPTYNRGTAVLSVLEKIHQCDPKPAEIWVHIDMADGALERQLNQRFPQVRVLTSTTRLGPGGGRHRCLVSCTMPYAVSFDDDSYPVDVDFFGDIQRLFSMHPRVAVLGASIWHRNEIAKVRKRDLVPIPNHIGCGFAIRVAAYRQIRGYLPLPVSYEMEESDVSLQLFAAGWQIYEAGCLRVFHDTDRTHHASAEITSATITNVALRAFLHYPIVGWGWGLLQVANKIAYCVRMGRVRGICSGIFRIPVECYRNRRFRDPIAWPELKRYRQYRRS
jgi:GT2 family glycosyltransferase